MKKWIVRFVSLYLFNLVVLWIIGLVMGSVSVGWSAFWASVILTLGTIWVRPAITKWFRGMAAKSASQRTKIGEKLVQYLLVLAVAAIVWVLTVLLSGVGVRGFFWGWVLPPVLLVIAWAIYDAIVGRMEARAGDLYDKALGGRNGAGAVAGTDAAPAIPSPEAAAGRRELHDGLTDEQRKLLDEL